MGQFAEDDINFSMNRRRSESELSDLVRKDRSRSSNSVTDSKNMDGM
jgi:hypothetical protein